MILKKTDNSNYSIKTYLEVHHVIWLSRGDKRWSRRKRLWLRKQQFIAVNDSTAVEIPRLFCFSMTNSCFCE